ncbi:MAG TPA: hypothetical protein VKV04_24885, partial [Verrucomicrobiae bacterium]|nr:hypothetical protein [Verrucomicrobiae bacterium]
KTIKIICFSLTVIFVTAVHSFAIEGLQIAVPGTNALLWWPSDTSESYLIQYRHTLSVTDSWTTLADFYPPDFSGSNITYFIDTNFVDFGSDFGAGSGGTNSGGGGIEPMMAMGASSLASSEPIVLETNGDEVPLRIFPPGTDLSGMTIINPSTGQSISGSGLLTANAGAASPNGFQPDGADGSGTNSPGTGFYRVVRDGAHMFGVTNGAVWSGKVNIPLEVANPSGPYGTVVSIAIEAIDDNGNAAPIGGSQQLAPFNGSLVATVDTTQMSNGTYNLAAYAHWEDTNANEYEAISPPVSVTTSNEITFENFMPRFGDPANDGMGDTTYSLVFNATSAHTNVNWTVDFYDSSSNYVGSVTGNTPDGNISFTWDLTDGNGVAHTNDAFFNAYITTPYTDPPAPTFWKNSDPWFGPGQWCIAAQHVFEPPWYNILPTESTDIYDEMNEFVAQSGGNGGLNANTPSQPDGSAYAIAGLSSGGAANWMFFRKALYNPYTRNLVYFGHGGPTGLGWTSNNTSVFVPVTEIAQTLGNSSTTNSHAFRFAFIDACDTAQGNLCSALGIMQKPNVSILTYGSARIRPGTYCGWPSEKNIAEVLFGSANQDHINFIKHVEHIWYFYPTDIHTAVIQGAGFNDDTSMYNNDMVINGFWGLLPAAYNQ